MVYYIKAMAKGLTQKVALPLAFAASAISPAMADTTISIQGPTDNNIAFDEVDEIAIVMNSTDNVAGLDLNVKIPAGLEIVGDFVKKVSTHSYKVEETADGFHVMLWSDALQSIPTGDNTVIGTFKVKANTKLVNESTIDLTINDVRDIDNVKVSTIATVTPVNSDPITVDKSKLPGIVLVSAADGDDNPNLVMTTDYVGDMPLTNSLFKPETVAVTLKNTEAQVADLQAVLKLPAGLKLTDKGVWVNEERQVPNKVISVTPYIEDGQEVAGAYQIVYSGGLEPFNLNEGPLFYFEVEADLTLAATDKIEVTGIVISDLYGVHAAQNDLTITVQNLNQQAYEALNAADGKWGKLTTKANTPPYSRVYEYADAEDATINVTGAREAAEKKLDDEYKAGMLDVNLAEVEAQMDAYETVLDEATKQNEDIMDKAIRKEDSTLAQLNTSLEDKTKKAEAARAKAPATGVEDGGYRVNNANNTTLEAAYQDAEDAITAYENKVQELYDQASEGDSDKYDGALLADSKAENSEVAAAEAAANEAIEAYDTLIKELNKQNDANEAKYVGDAATLKSEFDTYLEENVPPTRIAEDTEDEKQIAYDAIELVNTTAKGFADSGILTDANTASLQNLDGKVQAAEDAIKAYKDEVARLEGLNDGKYDEYQKYIDDQDAETATDLAGQLAAAEQYVADLPNDETLTYTGAYADYENFPEIKEAIDAAKEAIQGFKDAVDAAHENGGLAFEDGEDGTDAIDALKPDVEAAIENIKTVADQAKADNDAAYQGGLQEAQNAKDAIVDLIVSEATADSKAYKEALDEANKAIEAFEDALNASNQKGMVAKDAQNEESKLAKAKVAMNEALKNLKTVADNLNDLNALIDACDTELQNAKDELQSILDDEKYNYIETSDKTKDLIEAINDKIVELEGRIGDLDQAINEEAGADALLNENGEVDDWKADLNKILDEINGTLNAETGKLEGGLDQDIENAVKEYDKFHKRGDANMDGRISIIDYNTILMYVREKLDINTVTSEQLSQLNVVQEEEFGTDIEVNITDATAALWIYRNKGTDEGLGLGDRYYNARATEAESLMASETMVGGVRRIALNLNNVMDYTAAQLDLVLPEGATLVAANLGERSNGHELFVDALANGNQRVVITNSELNAFKGNEGAVLYIDVQGDGDVQFNNVIFSTTHAQGTRFTVGAAAETTGIAGVKAAAEGEQVYSIGGRLMNAVKKGINIIRRADGTTQKVIKK